MRQIDLIGAEDAAIIAGYSRRGIIAAANAGRIPMVGRLGRKGILVFDKEEMRRIARERCSNE